MALSTKPYKGARDFYPEDKRIQKYIFSSLRQAVEKYGYEEYDAPIIEALELYQAKSGEEIVNDQTYSFMDRGGRQVVIRPEMTPSVSRMVAARRQELAYPLRWYSLPNLWRYERPQRGRLREHWQLNVDLFGVREPYAEVEIISVIDTIFQNFGASRDMYSIHLNDRRIVDSFLLNSLHLEQSQALHICKLIDKIHKMEHTAFISAVDAELSPKQKQDGATEKLLAYLSATDLKTVLPLLESEELTKNLRSTLEQLNAAGITNVMYDPIIMRGFDYYNGIVFEVFDLHPENNRAMLGGGRYDGLVGLFGVEAVPTIGFGFGDVTLANFLEMHHILPVLSPETQLYVVLTGIEPFAVQPLLTKLRGAHLNVAVDLSGRKLGDQIKNASKRNIRTVLIIGEKELADGRYTLRDLQSGTEEQMDCETLIKTFTDSL